MRRIILLLAVTVTMVMGGAKAQQLTATLQQGASMKVYYGENAFKEAYDNAQDGAKIILSAGMFKQVDSIAKSITIIGNGGLLYGNDNTCFYNMYRKNEGFPGVTDNFIESRMLINANNVSVEGIYMPKAVILRTVSGLHLTRCYIGQLFCTGKHTNTIIDQCYLKLDGADHQFNSDGDALSMNCCIKNSFVEGFLRNTNSGGYLSETMTILNSVVMRSFYFVGKNDVVWVYSNKATIRNSVLGSLYYSTGGKTDEIYWNGYRKTCNLGSNNLLFLYPYHYTASDSEEYDDTAYELIDYLKSQTPIIQGLDKGNVGGAYDAIFDESVPWYNSNYINTTITGDDGTVVGPYGGSGFSLYPSIPRITESKIDTYTDGDGKLNVKVKVEVGQ